jgi:hypothetical protein
MQILLISRVRGVRGGSLSPRMMDTRYERRRLPGPRVRLPRPCARTTAIIVVGAMSSERDRAVAEHGRRSVEGLPPGSVRAELHVIRAVGAGAMQPVGLVGLRCPQDVVPTDQQPAGITCQPLAAHQGTWYVASYEATASEQTVKIRVALRTTVVNQASAATSSSSDVNRSSCRCWEAADPDPGTRASGRTCRRSSLPARSMRTCSRTPRPGSRGRTG